MRRLQFSIRTLFLLIILTALLSWPLLMWRDAWLAREEIQALSRIRALGGNVVVAYAGHAKRYDISLINWLGNDEDLGLLRHLSSVRSLRAGLANVSDSGLRHIEALHDLNALSLFGNADVTDQGMTRLRGLVNLRSLDLGATSVSDRGLAHLERLRNLESLGLALTDITDRALDHVSQLPNLKTLSLAYTQVSDHGLPRLECLTKLEVLELQRTAVSDAAIGRLRRALPRLVVRVGRSEAEGSSGRSAPGATLRR
jgi:hypothetical protein